MCVKMLPSQCSQACEPPDYLSSFSNVLSLPDLFCRLSRIPALSLGLQASLDSRASILPRLAHNSCVCWGLFSARSGVTTVASYLHNSLPRLRTVPSSVRQQTSSFLTCLLLGGLCGPPDPLSQRTAFGLVSLSSQLLCNCGEQAPRTPSSARRLG